jgi:hypothetical protein
VKRKKVLARLRAGSINILVCSDALGNICFVKFWVQLSSAVLQYMRRTKYILFFKVCIFMSNYLRPQA